jgi:hypothetical protein
MDGSERQKWRRPDVLVMGLSGRAESGQHVNHRSSACVMFQKPEIGGVVSDSLPPGQPDRQMSPQGHHLPHPRPMAWQPPQPTRKQHRVRNIVLGVIALWLIIGAIGAALSSNKTGTKTGSHHSAVSIKAAPTPATTPSKSPSSLARKSTGSAEAACESRGFASGDIYVRMITPGEAPIAQELGGEWDWDAARGRCLTSVRFMIASAPQTPGNCTQVGYVADNPGYDPNANVAKPLKQVVAQTGPAC